MNKKKNVLNTWHTKLYDELSADMSINGKTMRLQARQQINDLCQLLSISKLTAKTLSVLDVPCGTGRHTVEFTKYGFQVTGVDINPNLLRIARKNLKTSKVKAKVHAGNMLKLNKYKKKFDLVVNLFTSIGYFENDKKNEECLHQLFNAVKPGGKVIIETTHFDYLKRIFAPVSWTQESNLISAEMRKFNFKTRYNEGIQSFVDLKTGSVSTHYHRIRIYSYREMKKLFKKFGAKRILIYGDLNGSDFDPQSSRRMVFVVEK